MTFNELLNEIEKLVGLDLDSIARAEGIKITKVDRTNKRIELVTETGREVPRSFEEMKKVWDRLCKDPAVHVDSVLGGSSTSRNQPETILANLPNVEWLRFNNKKHITLRSEPTHEYGTLKKMDEFDAEEVKEKLRTSAAILSEVVIISDDLKTASENFESITGLKLEAIDAGIYRKVKDGVGYLVTSRGQVTGAIEPGTYPIVKGISRPHNGRQITVGEREFFLIQGGGLNLLISLE
ncbi:hypothetical protein [Paenibacillus sp.]|uniref:hypothetical protein n=1 Tax=Paenibacillus sp. TaxID=58172 RepID=UPI00356B5B92